MQVLVRDDDVDQALKVLKKKMQREGVFREMKLRGHYEKPIERRRVARKRKRSAAPASSLVKSCSVKVLLPMKPRPAPGTSGRSAPPALLVSDFGVSSNRKPHCQRNQSDAALEKKAGLKEAFEVSSHHRSDAAIRSLTNSAQEAQVRRQQRRMSR